MIPPPNKDPPLPYLHLTALVTLALCSLVTAYGAWTAPHPIHPYLAGAVALGLFWVCGDLWNRETSK